MQILSSQKSPTRLSPQSCNSRSSPQKSSLSIILSLCLLMLFPSQMTTKGDGVSLDHHGTPAISVQKQKSVSSPSSFIFSLTHLSVLFSLILWFSLKNPSPITPTDTQVELQTHVATRCCQNQPYHWKVGEFPLSATYWPLLSDTSFFPSNWSLRGFPLLLVPPSQAHLHQEPVEVSHVSAIITPP